MLCTAPEVLLSQQEVLFFWVWLLAHNLGDPVQEQAMFGPNLQPSGEAMAKGSFRLHPKFPQNLEPHRLEEKAMALLELLDEVCTGCFKRLLRALRHCFAFSGSIPHGA